MDIRWYTGSGADESHIGTYVDGKFEFICGFTTGANRSVWVDDETKTRCEDCKSKISEKESKKMDLKWVSCSKDADWSTSEKSHLVAPGSLDTLCNASASHLDVWRGNNTKPRCEKCIEQADSIGYTYPKI